MNRKVNLSNLKEATGIHY